MHKRESSFCVHTLPSYQSKYMFFVSIEINCHFPGGGVMGVPGRQASQVAIKALK